MKNNTNSIQKGAYILIISALISKIIGALFKLPLSSQACLGDLGFGYFSVAYDLFVPIQILAISGFPVAISHIIAKISSKNDTKVMARTFNTAKALLLSIGFFGMIAFVLFIFPFVKFTDATSKSLLGMLAIAPSILFCALSSLYRGYFEGISNMRPPAISNIIEALSKLVFGYLFAYFSLKSIDSLPLAAAAALLGISFGTLLSALYLRNRFNKVKTFKLNEGTVDKALLNTLLMIAIPIAISSLSGSIISLVDAMTVRKALDISFAKNGELLNEYVMNFGVTYFDSISTVLYGVRSKAFTVYNLIPTLIISLGVSIVPSISKAKEEKNLIAIKESISKAIRLTALIVFPAAAGFIVLNEKIMVLLFGYDFSSYLSGKIIFFYGIAVLFSGFAIVLSNILQALGKQNSVLRNILIGVVVKVILNLVLIANPQFNIFGSVISTIITYFVIFILNLLSLYMSEKIGINIKWIYKPLLAAIICGVSAFLITQIHYRRTLSILAILVAAVIYFAFLLLTKFFEKEDFSELPFADKIIKFFKRT